MARSKSMKKTFIMSFVYPIVIFTAVVLISIGLLVTYLATKQIAVLIIMLINAILGLLAFGLVFATLVQHQYSIYYKGVYGVTKRNLKSLYDSSVDLEKYPEYPPINEISELNEEISKLKIAFDNSTLVAPKCDYSAIEFDYVPGLDHVITAKSLTEQLSMI